MADSVAMPVQVDEPVTDESDAGETFVAGGGEPVPSPASAAAALTPTGGASKDVPVTDIEWEKDVIDVSWRWHWLRIQANDMRRCIEEEKRFLAEHADPLPVCEPRPSEGGDEARSLRTSGLVPPTEPRRLLQRRVQSYVLASQSHDWGMLPGACTVHGGGGGGGGGSNNNKPSNVVHFREPHPLFSFRGASTISSRKKPSSYPLAALATVSGAVGALTGSHTKGTAAGGSKAGGAAGASSSSSSKGGGASSSGGGGGGSGAAHGSSAGKARSRPKSAAGRPRTPTAASSATRKRSHSARSSSDRKRKPPRTRDYDINSISVPLQTHTTQAITVAKPKNIECPGVRPIPRYWEKMDELVVQRERVMASTGVDSDEDTADEAYFRRHVIKEELEKKQLLPKLRRRKETVAAAAARAAAELRMEDVPLPAFVTEQRARVQSPLPRDTLLALAGRTRVKMDVDGYCGTPTKALKFWDDLTPHKAIQLPDEERKARAAAAQARFDEKMRIRRELEAAQAEMLKSPRSRGVAGGGGALGSSGRSPGTLPGSNTQVLWREDNAEDLLFLSDDGDDASDADPEFSLHEPKRRRERDRRRDRNRNRKRKKDGSGAGGRGKGRGKGKGKGKGKGHPPSTPASLAPADVRTPRPGGATNARTSLSWEAPPVPPAEECGQWKGSVAVDAKARAAPGKSGIKLCFRQLARPNA